MREWRQDKFINLLARGFMSILQLNPLLPMTTPKGDGYAWALLDYGAEHNLMWVVCIDATGEIWTFQNPQVRGQKNITMGRLMVQNSAQKLNVL